MTRSLKISITAADAFEFDTDVLILKYAQAPHGADRAALERLARIGVRMNLPKPGEFTLQESLGSMKPRSVLLVGVKPLQKFGYSEIRDFGRQALTFLSKTIHIRTIALTIHGSGYGLDEVEAFQSELAGVVEAISNRHFPSNLESIVFVEHRPDRVHRLTQSLKTLLPDGIIPINDRGSIVGLRDEVESAFRTAGYVSSAKPHVFVAMPFAQEMDDIFHHGIQGAVNSAGLLCERADLSAFTGDVMDWVKNRISSATLVVADLSSANPNVYLEVGYAWGSGVPTVLLAKDLNDIKFDVRGQRCLLYRSIKNLEELLRKELLGVLGSQ